MDDKEILPLVAKNLNTSVQTAVAEVLSLYTIVNKTIELNSTYGPIWNGWTNDSSSFGNYSFSSTPTLYLDHTDRRPKPNESSEDLTTDDAAWILTTTFIIFTMQTGFGLLEAGCVSMKNESNIMIKNVVDVVLGGFTYWLFGYGLCFGESSWANPFCGWGDFALNPENGNMGFVYTKFFFQLSFATTATTIVSGAVAERFNFLAYIMFSAINTIVYCIPASWIWNSRGFLRNLGVIDIAGSCAVHLCGGTSALVAAYMVGPRLGRYDHGTKSLPLGSPTSCLLGMFMLWWGWLGFNCGSTFGIAGHKWKYAARSAVTTLQASIGGGFISMIVSWIRNNKIMIISDLVNGVLGALVSVTAGCALYEMWEALIVGMVGGFLPIVFVPILDRYHLDDPVGAVSVHGICAIWAMLAIALFVKNDDRYLNLTGSKSGIFRGGGFYLFGVQCLACVSTIAWAAIVTFLILRIIDKFLQPIRMSEWEELVGADFAEHGIRRKSAGISRAISVLGSRSGEKDLQNIQAMGDNPCHQAILRRVQKLRDRKPSMVTSAVKKIFNMANEYRNPVILVNGDNQEKEKTTENRRFSFSDYTTSSQKTPSKNDLTVTDLEEQKY